MIEGTKLANWIDNITCNALFGSRKEAIVENDVKLNPAMYYYAGTQEPFPLKNKKKVISQTQPWTGTAVKPYPASETTE